MTSRPLRTRRRAFPATVSRTVRLRNAAFGLCIVFVAAYLLFVGTSIRSIRQGNRLRQQQKHAAAQQNSIHHAALTDPLPELDREPLRKFMNAMDETFHHSHPQEPPPEQCSFRRYSPRRYYGLPQQQTSTGDGGAPDVSSIPSFLRDVEYIYGEAPVLLEPAMPATKLCVNQTSWLTKEETTQPTGTFKVLPFADGTNPSLLSLDRLQHTDYYALLTNMGGKYLATICMTNSQCAWKDSPEEIKEYGISSRSAPNTVQTLLLLLDGHFQTLAQTTLYLERDAQWGSRTPAKKLPDESGYVLDARAFDDARLFVHQQQLHVSYREGKGFGYDKQVLNPIHIRANNQGRSSGSVAEGSPTNGSFQAIVKASETSHFCCGRNMALMPSETNLLQSLTWVDPITVITVDDKEKHGAKQQTRKMKGTDNNHKDGGNGHKSHVHGTNAFMVEFGQNLNDESSRDGQDELLGIAHFHRPPDRKENDYARFGHHYTHAFFTIPANGPSFQLLRLSPEFVLPSFAHPDDAEIIQFWSGLEVTAASSSSSSSNIQDESTVVVAYGINDCEGAVVTFPKKQVNALLRDVPDGHEVVDLMSKLTL